MPKPFSENERAIIKQRLQEEASTCLKLYGMRKMTVDELVKRVNIPKGTFYLFYPSKELLVYDVLNKFHDEIHAELQRQVENILEPVSAEMISDLVFDLYRKVETSNLFSFVTSGDWELLMRKLPQETTREQNLQDDISIERLLLLVPGIDTTHTKLYGAALRAIFLSMIHKREIGEDMFESSLKLLLDGIFIQIFKEATP